MAKKGGAGGIGRPSDLLNSMQSDGWKQRLRTEEKIMKMHNSKAIESLQVDMDKRNTYLSYFKREDKIQESEELKNRQEFAYDVVHDQKQRIDPKKRVKQMQKDVMALPVTSSNTYGWFEPIDTFQYAPKRNGICQKTFNDTTHLGG